MNSDGSGSHAYYSVGMWTCLAAMVLLFLGMILVFFTCCSERRKGRKTGGGGVDHQSRQHKRRSHKSDRDAYENDGYHDDGYGAPYQARSHHATTTKTQRNGVRHY